MNTVHLCGEAKDAVAKHQERMSHVRLCMWALIGSSALHVSPTEYTAELRCMKMCVEADSNFGSWLRHAS